MIASSYRVTPPATHHWKLFLLAASLFLLATIVDGSVVPASAEGRVIYSYYWPIAEGQNDLLHWNMETPDIVDVTWQSSDRNWQRAKEYWEKRGKSILYRVQPFTGAETGNEMYDRFAKNLKQFKGISVDEIVTHELTREQAETFNGILIKLRRAYPDKMIAIWISGYWTKENVFLLETIRDYADMVLPEIYVAQSTAKSEGLSYFIRYLRHLENCAPGITAKTVMGIGMYQKLADGGSQSFRDHLAAQILLLCTDPLFAKIKGIALYAPVYLSAQDQQWLDDVLKKHFVR
jgi:hypothetical protein